MNQAAYIKAHELLMREMRKQVRLGNRKKIVGTGKRLHRLRVRYREKFAA